MTTPLTQMNALRKRAPALFEQPPAADELLLHIQCLRQALKRQQVFNLRAAGLDMDKRTACAWQTCFSETNAVLTQTARFDPDTASQTSLREGEVI